MPGASGVSKRRQQNAARVRRAEQVQPSYLGRRRAVMALLAVTTLVVTAGAYYQQIWRKDFLQQRAENMYLGYMEIPAHRGVITDRNGEILAVSTPVDSVSANPKRFNGGVEQMKALAKVMGKGADELQQRLSSHSGKDFVFLERWLTPEDAAKVVAEAQRLGIKGIKLEREYRRYYPTGEVFAHVVGIAGRDDVGQEGLELFYENHLRGAPGRKWVITDAQRRLVEDVQKIEAPKEGQDLQLSLDRRLQFVAYKALKSAVTKHRAKSGSAVLLDARTGEVLAMVNQPAYNPNSDRSDTGGRKRNRALTDVFEPGSTMKPFTVSAALDMGTIKESTGIDTGSGEIHIGAQKVSDPRSYGVIDPATVLRKSSNVGAAKIALGMPRDKYWRFLSHLGFGTATGVGFPGEADGHLADYNNWATIDQATLAFGYGISVSTLQLAQAYAVLAGDGIRRPASLLRQDGPPAGERVTSADVVRKVRHMMEAVTSDTGTAPLAKVPGFRVAGKTGTVKKLGRGGYEDDKYRSLFAGMAPASDPRLVLVVMIDEPRAGEFYGGRVAGPVFSEIMTQALRLLNVPPDDEQLMSDLRLAGANGGAR
jgi:cell division protein FtsI (penicillin-binding protein 3)